MWKIKAKDIIYAEVASGGTMGNAGGLILYIFKKGRLRGYDTNMYHKIVYKKAAKLLYPNIKNYKKDYIFDYYYGGVGNDVFINKDISLKIGDECFILEINSKKFKLYTSVLGVFMRVAKLLKENRNEEYPTHMANFIKSKTTK